MLYKRVSANELVVGAPAKINLFLQVLNRREDGYHNINSAFQAVSLFDRLRMCRTGRSDEFLLRLSDRSTVGADLPCDDSNLVLKACRLLRARYDLPGGIAIELEKHIPVAAGLGGGSSDAAASLYAANVLYDLGLSRPELASLGLELGSDIPFFFGTGMALVGGRGEQIIETQFPLDYWVVLVTPATGVATGAAYAQLRRGLTNSKHPFSLPRCETVGELVEALQFSENDFEEVHLLSSTGHQRIKDGLLECGARLARMSGSGSTVFGIFDSPP
ncbi:4-(cytidine 5'-diphospho)-2-C-methyl-D-erythritol kinase, partial [candidate division GN15 bacterium]|nr:4-(cytidine 5'-diphospho)-2-C-methyl-D-erythritol kinase [candidate division GN15 bacterium]